MRPTLEQYRLHGTGPKGSVCLLMVRDNGIGDDVNALPVVASLAEENDVTVYTIHPELWRNIHVSVVGVAMDFMTCENGEVLDMTWDAAHLARYELIYKLSGWGVWDDNEKGGSYRTRFEQLDEILGVSTIVETFDYVAALGAQKIDVEKPYVILSVESHEVMRSLPLDSAFELYCGLLNYSDVVWLTQDAGTKRRTKCNSLQELVNLVYNAERVVGIDNGVAHVACALRRSVALIGGMTDIRRIFGQYGAPLRVLQSKHEECFSPCYHLARNGFKNKQCCGSYATPRCMEGVGIEQVISLAYLGEETHTNAT